MKRALASLAAVTFAAAACGSDGPETATQEELGDVEVVDANPTVEPAPTVTVTETVSPEPTPKSEEDDEEASVAPKGSSYLTGEDRLPIEERLNDRGNLPMPDNSPYFWASPDDESPLVAIQMGDVETEVTCPAPHHSGDTEGLISIDFEVTVEPEVSEFEPSGYWLTSDMFQIMNQEGNIVAQSADTLDAFSCSDDAFPFGDIRPGTTGAGPVILESPVDSGCVLYQDIGTGNYFEWEF